MPEKPPDPGAGATSLTDRRARLRAALQTLREHAASPAGAKLAGWLNSWKGVGAIVAGMTAQGFDVELQQYPHGWWAKFYLTGASHPVCAGSGWASKPWAAVQGAAWETLTGGDPQSRLREQLANADATRRPNPAGGPAAALRAPRRSPDDVPRGPGNEQT